jgi:hypothetical protein
MNAMGREVAHHSRAGFWLQVPFGDGNHQLETTEIPASVEILASELRFLASESAMFVSESHVLECFMCRNPLRKACTREKHPQKLGPRSALKERSFN